MADRGDMGDVAIVAGDLKRRGGRPLDPARDDAIRQAALHCLAEVGYEKLTMDQVAARAKAGKGALYRRWPSKEALVVDAVICAKPAFEFEPTGSLRGDLDAYIAAGADPDDTHRPDQDVARGLIKAAVADPEFAALLRQQFTMPRQQALRGIIERAQARGEAEPDLDLDLIVDLIPAMFIARTVLGLEITSPPELLAQIINHVVYPLVRRA
jgi:AcrR family transcriptional regulator